MQKSLLVVTAVIEILAGLGFLVLPGLAVSVMFGTTLQLPLEEVICRMAGSALLAIGVACQLARRDEVSPAAKALTAGMLVYNFLVLLVLAYAGAGLGLAGLMLWPAVGLHIVMSAWCVASLRAK